MVNQVQVKNVYRNFGAVKAVDGVSIEIKKGEFFTEQNLIAKRPGYGLSPFRLKKLLGKKSLRRYKKNQIIK